MQRLHLAPREDTAGSEATKVRLSHLQGVHQVRLVEPGKKKKAGTDRPNLPSWDVLTADAEPELAPKYMITGNFEYGDFIMHSKFGLGCVVEVLTDERIQVSFEAGVKLLIQNYSR